MRNKNVNSVGRVFAIIEALSSYPNGCSLALLAEETELNKSTVHRFLKTLQQLGYISVATVAGSYRLTFKIANIGQKLIYETNVVQLAMPELTKLRNATKETVNLKNSHNEEDIIVFKLDPKSGNFRTRSYVGQASPLYCTATGCIFLAYKGEAFIRKYWQKQKKNIKRMTESTITNLDGFLEKCDFAKKNGYVFDNEENELGISCIAAPIFNINKEVSYAVSISLQSVKLKSSMLKHYIKSLLECAEALSKELGYKK